MLSGGDETIQLSAVRFRGKRLGQTNTYCTVRLDDTNNIDAKDDDEVQYLILILLQSFYCLLVN